MMDSAAPPAAPGRIRLRRDFLAANRGARIVTPAFILLLVPNGTPNARFGFTVSKKVGNAVARNRARRRLREMARIGIGAKAVSGADHVFIARAMPGERPFEQLLADAQAALRRAAGKLGASA